MSWYALMSGGALSKWFTGDQKKKQWGGDRPESTRQGDCAWK